MSIEVEYYARAYNGSQEIAQTFPFDSYKKAKKARKKIRRSYKNNKNYDYVITANIKRMEMIKSV